MNRRQFLKRIGQVVAGGVVGLSLLPQKALPRNPYLTESYKRELRMNGWKPIEDYAQVDTLNWKVLFFSGFGNTFHITQVEA